MTVWEPAVLVLCWALLAAQFDLDCARPAEARTRVGQLMLAEIEGAEDIHRAVMWEAFGRCPAGEAGRSCRENERRRFEGQWEQQKKAIEAKYRTMLSEFEQRCRAAVTLARPAAAGAPST